MVSAKHPDGYRLGIVNPLTLVGAEIITILRERSFPLARVVLLDSTGQSTGALTDVGDDPAIVIAVSDDELEDCDLVFFCGSSAINREWIDRHRDDRFIAVDLSQPGSSEEGKLVVAGINLESVEEGDDLLVSPHPVALPLALILHQLSQLVEIELGSATVVQPASELEQAGMEELAKQTLGILNITKVPIEIFGRQLAFNLYPAPQHHEELILAQVRTLTTTRTELALMVTQGTIFHGHTFSLFVKTREEVTREQIAATLRANPAIALPEGDQTFATIDSAGRDEVLVAEIRPDPAIRRGFWLWAACDNVRRGTALNAVLIAEKALLGTGPTN
jgi:aspartate-semialdehyde dehydrogenase